jgi:serine/threonine-protein kinase
MGGASSDESFELEVSSDAIEHASGSVAGKYRLFASLGRGGMADVLLGVAQGPKGFNKLVVVKRLRGNLAADASLVNMFLDEARLAARLSHPNVVTTFEVGEQRGAYFIAMEYLDGQPLNKVMRAMRDGGEKISPVMWAKIMADACSGLHHAHELTDYDGTPMDVVHRDVSPQNIFITYDGRVKIVDFGIAKAALNTSETETGVLKGKIAYMAPEQAAGGKVDRRADVFSTGIVMWELLTGEKLVTGNAATCLHKILNMPIPRPSEKNPDVPLELDAIVMCALERQVENRWQTSHEMRQALEAFARASGQLITEEEISVIMKRVFAEKRAQIRQDIQKYMAMVAEVSARDLLISSGSHPTISLASHTTSVGDEDSDRSANGAMTEAATPGSKRGKRVLLAAAAIGLLIAGVTIFVLRPKAPPQQTTITPVAANEAPRTVHVAINVTPQTATVHLDDAALPQNPFSGPMPSDTREHRVRATAPGYVAETKTLRLDRDVSLEFELRPEPQPATSTAPQASTKPAQQGGGRPAPPPPNPTERKRPPLVRPNLEDNPWK